VRANLRDDLALVATSATADTVRLSRALGADGPAPVVTATAARHEVAVEWTPPPVATPLLPGGRVDPRLLDHVADVVRRACAENEGDVLVFVPGEAEIHGVSRRLAGENVLPLFGRQSRAEQERALTPSVTRRVVVTTSVAESSLTVPGVRVVVDSGLAREPRTDQARGLGALVTTRVSRSSAEQRAGRAGREAPGRVYRCWAEPAHARLDHHPAPERATAVGAHPRLARALLDGAPRVGADRAREIVALLSDDSGRGAGDDLPARWRALRRGDDRAATARWREEVRRLGRGASDGPAADGRD